MISERIKQLVNYGAEKKLITEADRIYATNLLLDAMGEQSYEDPGEVPAASLEEILGALCDIAAPDGASHAAPLRGHREIPKRIRKIPRGGDGFLL